MSDVQSFFVGQWVRFAGLDSLITGVGERGGQTIYLIENGPDRLAMSVPEDILKDHQRPDRPPLEFVPRSPDVIVVDDFLTHPDQVRTLALAQEYEPDLRYYKGVRSNQRFLWPHLREEFGRLIGRKVTEWLGHPANGVFQQTSFRDPLVWHHDEQRYAAAIYLNPNPPRGAGTSFWRDRTYGCRRRPGSPSERQRLGSEEAVRAAEATVYDPYNIVHDDNWELVESVAGIYNRLVIWDADLFHSATSYAGFVEGTDLPTRLVQLFFFDAD